VGSEPAFCTTSRVLSCGASSAAPSSQLQTQQVFCPLHPCEVAVGAAYEKVAHSCHKSPIVRLWMPFGPFAQKVWVFYLHHRAVDTEVFRKSAPYLQGIDGRDRPESSIGSDPFEAQVKRALRGVRRDTEDSGGKKRRAGNPARLLLRLVTDTEFIVFCYLPEVEGDCGCALALGMLT
jgi:hypothetical protein